MASFPLTLAAFATSAVPGLSAVAVRAHTGASGDYSSAVLTTEDDELIVSVPRTSQAETTQSASILGLSALTDGARGELPFAVPRVLGMTRAGDTRAVVTSFLDGDRIDVAELRADALLVESIAETVAAVHALPRSIAQQGGLPERSARDVRLVVARLVDRAQATRFLPETIYQRWTTVLETAEIWDFEPCMVHGSINDDSLLVDADGVVGVLDWSELGVGDPASDLFWLFSAGPEVFEAVVLRYLTLADVGDAAALRARAKLYHELEVARWLLHGVETHDQSAIDDAVDMLDRLVDRAVQIGGVVPPRAVVTETEAEAMLEFTPEVVDGLSDTAAFEGLDEDRQFGFDTDFIEPLRPEPQDAGQSAADDGSAPEPTTKTASTSNASADTAKNDDPDEQLTAPIDDITR